MFQSGLCSVSAIALLFALVSSRILQTWKHVGLRIQSFAADTFVRFCMSAALAGRAYSWESLGRCAAESSEVDEYNTPPTILGPATIRTHPDCQLAKCDCLLLHWDWGATFPLPKRDVVYQSINQYIFRDVYNHTRGFYIDTILCNPRTVIGHQICSSTRIIN